MNVTSRKYIDFDRNDRDLQSYLGRDVKKCNKYFKVYLLCGMWSFFTIYKRKKEKEKSAVEGKYHSYSLCPSEMYAVEC